MNKIVSLLILSTCVLSANGKSNRDADISPEYKNKNSNISPKSVKKPNFVLIVADGLCSPSRALLTGINQVTFGHDNNMGGNQPGFDPVFLEGAG